MEINLGERRGFPEMNFTVETRGAVTDQDVAGEVRLDLLGRLVGGAVVLAQRDLDLVRRGADPLDVAMEHVGHCVADAIRAGDGTQKVQELTQAVERLVRS